MIIIIHRLYSRFIYQSKKSLYKLTKKRFKLSMRHQKAKRWERKLKTVFDDIDAILEEEFGDLFPLHPSRPQEGHTANPESDGLFNVGASFSAGFGSSFGPSYVVEIRISTLQQTPMDLKVEIRDRVKNLLQQKLPEAFQGKQLTVAEEDHYLRIHGDLSLD